MSQFFRDDQYGYVRSGAGREYRYWFVGLETESEWQPGDPMPVGQVLTEIEESPIPADSVPDDPGSAERQAVDREVGKIEATEIAVGREANRS